MVCARPPPEWQPETQDPSNDTEDHQENIPRRCGFTTNMLDTCLWTHTTKRVALAFHVDDLLLAGKHQTITEILPELSQNLELKSNEVTTKPTR